MLRRLAAVPSLIIVLLLAGSTTVGGTPSAGRGVRPSFMPVDTYQKLLGEVQLFKLYLEEMVQAWECICRRPSMANLQRQGREDLAERYNQIPGAQGIGTRSKCRDCHHHSPGQVQALCPVSTSVVTQAIIDVENAFALHGLADSRRR